MATDYKPDIWYGWNGGECPVHPKTTIVVKWSCNGVETAPEEASLFSEHHWRQPNICAFRVVKEYREPRELWHLLDRDGQVFDTFTNVDDAKHDLTQYANFTLVHYREVMEDEA